MQGGSGRSKCEVHLEQRDGELFVCFAGELDVDCDELRDDVLAEAERHRADDITIDCTRVTFADLHGLDFLLQIASAAATPGPVTLLHPDPAVLRIIDRFQAGDAFRLVRQPDSIVGSGPA